MDRQESHTLELAGILRPKAIVNLKNVPEQDRTLWVRESIDDVAKQIAESGWLVVHRMHGPSWEEYRVACGHVVSFTVYS
jgi:hypothetical protein